MQGPSDNREDAISELNVIPFIDICLVLLIIVIMSSAKSQTEDVEIKVPTSNIKGSADINLALTMSVDKNGNYYFEENLENPIERKNLFTVLREVRRNSGAWPLLVIKADKEAPYGEITTLIQAAQILGVTRISIATEKEKEKE
ncbi:MAG: biopolymer transporter ExbD [Lentisphaeria bacterium]|nr:biopolymer transporter ExbD [Lentisphaeria bacterium]NQZ68751.1 biopolymer transporter ExbD [Lentisphaeria bacterium]